MELTPTSPKHPAKYTNSFIPMFASILSEPGYQKILDPFAGVGKIGSIRQHGFSGQIYANEIEPEWILPNEYGCDVITTEDAECLTYPDGFFDAVCTSPTYGNRMADHHNAKDGSNRITYTHCLGRTLHEANTGKMQWGEVYRRKHEAIYKNLVRMIRPGGVFILNISNHIRKGQEVDVCSFHVKTLEDLGMVLSSDTSVETPRMRQGRNGAKRVRDEHIYVLRKP